LYNINTNTNWEASLKLFYDKAMLVKLALCVLYFEISEKSVHIFKAISSRNDFVVKSYLIFEWAES